MGKQSNSETYISATDARRMIALTSVCAILLAAIIAFFLTVFGAFDSKREFDGTFYFDEYVGTVHNPGVGYTTTDSLHASLGKTSPHDKQGDVVLFFVYLGEYSSGMNGKENGDGSYTPGEDHDLDDEFFSALRKTFENCRDNGSTIALRFRYDENGKQDPEPASFDFVLKHIAQIKKSGILEEYKDILMFVESGFVGMYGEQHGGKYVSVDYKARLLAAMLDCVPSPVPVTVRTPDIFAKYVGIERSELKDYIPKPGSDEVRVGLYNDGYMGSDNDLGTYSNREAETTWLSRQTQSYFGGEFSGNVEYAKTGKAYLPENCIGEMYKTHLSYINGNIFELYKGYRFSEKYDVEGIDNSAYYGKTVFDFIRDHIGYRFVLKKSRLPIKIERGGIAHMEFDLVNNGFASPVKRFKSELILEKNGRFVPIDINLDPMTWQPGDKVSESLDVKLPGLCEPGRWNVLLKFSIGNIGFEQYTFRSIRFANKGTFDAALGANRIGYIDIEETDDIDKLCDNTVGETDGDLRKSHLYTVAGVKIDGIMSYKGEWADDNVVATDGNKKLYVRADEKFIYIAANLPHGSKAPVFNVHLTSGDGQSFWLYRQSNGVTYFNRESQYGKFGVRLGFGKDMFEYAIPLSVMDLSTGDEISKLSVSIQDSADDWKGKGNIGTQTPFVLKAKIDVFSGKETVSVKSGDSFEYAIETNVDAVKIEWRHNGFVMKGADGFVLKIGNVIKGYEGVYTALITTSKGNTAEIDAAVLSVIGA